MNIFVSAVLLLATLGPTGGAHAAKKKAPDAASAGTSLPVLAPSTAPITVGEIIRRFEAFESSFESLAAEFEQTVRLQEAGTRSVHGSLSYRKPRSLRIEHTRPSRQSLIASGDTLWIHRHENNQVIQSTLADWKKAEPLASSLVDFSSYSLMLKSYDVSIDSTAPSGDGHRGIVLSLVPRDARANFALRLKLDTRDYFPAEAEMTADAAVVSTRFSKVRLNPEIPTGHFDFKPPPDADVFMNFKPPIRP